MAERHELKIDPEELYSGCVYLGSLFTAYLAECGGAEDRSIIWSGDVFVFNDLEGVDGCLVFGNGGKTFAGALRNINVYEQYARKYRVRTGETFAAAEDESVRSGLGPEALGNMTLYYVDIAAAESGSGPLVTTGFWRDPDGVFSCDCPEEFEALGGSFVTGVLTAGKNVIKEFFREEYAPQAEDLWERAEHIYEAKISCK